MFLRKAAAGKDLVRSTRSPRVELITNCPLTGKMIEELELERKTAVNASRESAVHEGHWKETVEDYILFYDGLDDAIKIETVKFESSDEECLNSERLMFDHIVSRQDLTIVSTEMPCIYKDQTQIGEVKIEAFDSTEYPGLENKSSPTNRHVDQIEIEEVKIVSIDNRDYPGCKKNNSSTIRQDQFQTSSIVGEGASSTKSCKECGDSFSNIELLRNHVKVHYRCDACNKSYEKKIFLDYHNATKHPSIEHSRTYITHKQCAECGKTILTKNLKRHIKVHKKDAPFRCEICNKTFKRLDSLDGHHFAYHPSMEYERAHLGRQCPECGKTFSSGSYKRHLLVHLPSALFCCKICKKTYRLKTSLDQHMITKHRSSEDP